MHYARFGVSTGENLGCDCLVYDTCNLVGGYKHFVGT